MANIETFEYEYLGLDSHVKLQIDRDVFTEEMAGHTLEFYDWDYDEEADPINEVASKYAIQALRYATFNQHTTAGVIQDFQEGEGYYPVDGTHGIRLIHVDHFEFYEGQLELKNSRI